MDTTYQRYTDLFAQLGLPSDTASIKFFLTENSPLSGHIRLDEAPFWTISQATFLREKIHLDADWALVVDQLSAALRGPNKYARSVNSTHLSSRS